MITGLLALLTCQLVGQFLVDTLHLPVPGPVLGMFLLLVVLQIRRPARDSSAARAGDALLRNLQLLFVPAGVGIIAHLSTLERSWLPVVGGLVLSWVVVVTVTAGAATAVLRLQRRSAGSPARPVDTP